MEKHINLIFGVALFFFGAVLIFKARLASGHPEKYIGPASTELKSWTERYSDNPTQARNMKYIIGTSISLLGIVFVALSIFG